MILPVFLLSNCANNKPVVVSKPIIEKQEKKSVVVQKSCKEKSRIRTSDNTFILFRHDITEIEEYRKVATDWCNGFSKIPIEGKLKCGSCCDASYFCK